MCDDLKAEQEQNRIPLKAEDLREEVFALSRHEQFRLATFVAENVGYVLVPEDAN